MILPPSSENISRAADALRRGECVGMPTETVYGLAGDGMNPVAVARIFDIKKRPSFDPLILHVASAYDLSGIVKSVPETAQKLMQRFWPGPLTLILPRNTSVPELVTAGLDTVAVRCPDHPVAQDLLRHFGGPLAAPSANPFGRLSPTLAEAVEDELGGKIAMTLDGGACRVGVESTIVDCRGAGVNVLRLGAVSVEELERTAGPVQVIKNNTLVAPGMLENHYAPRTNLYLCESLEAGPLPPGAAGLAFSGGPAHRQRKVLSSAGDLREAATFLFAFLRDLDRCGATLILAERVPELGLGRAINDRLKKASTGTASWGAAGWVLSQK